MLLVAALNAGFPARADQHAAVDTWALASWVEPTDRPNVYTWYFAEVERREMPAEGKSVDEAYLGKGSCHVEEHKDSWGMSCVGSGPGGFPYDFEIDPLGSSASLRVDTKGLRATVDWTSSPADTGWYQAGEGCSNGHESGEGHGGGLYRQSVATGTMFGHELKTNTKYEDAEVMRGVMVTECDYRDASALEFKRLPGGRVRATASYTIPSR